MREAGLLLGLDRHLRDLADVDATVSPLAFDRAMESLDAGCEELSDDPFAAAQVGERELASIR
jgi:hypothetical protein